MRPFLLREQDGLRWDGRVPYRVVSVGDEELLIVRGLPYPGTLRGDSLYRTHIELGGTWRYRADPNGIGNDEEWWRPEYDDSEWDTVEIPSTMNPARGAHTDYLGIIWFRRELSLTPPHNGMARLCFDGLLLRGSVWWNGELVGEFEGGYTTNFFDVSNLLSSNNTLVVACDNRLTTDSLPPRSMRYHNPGWHTYLGIHRRPRLEFLPNDHVVTLRTAEEDESIDCRVVVRDGAARDSGPDGIDQSSHDTESARDDFHTAMEIRIGVEGGTMITAELAGRLDSDRLSLWRAKIPRSDLPVWSKAEPSQIDLIVEIHREGSCVDRISQRTARRTIAVRGEEILVNGESTFLRGICRHEDHPETGATQTESTIATDLDLVEKLHANYVRLAHYPHDPRAIDRFEDAGLYQSEEIPLYQAGTGFTAWWSEHGRLRDFPARLFGIRQTRRRELVAHARRQLLEMIERDRHHPSILFWSVGNESYSIGRRAARALGDLADLARRWDASRPVTYVELTYNIPFFDDRRRGWEGADILSLNSYFGWYFGEAKEFERHVTRLHERWRGKPLIMSEFGAGAAPGRMDADGPWRGDRVQTERTYAEDYQARLLETHWRIAKKYPWIRGFSPWVLADFYNIWFPANPVPNFNLKGVVSADRYPKQGFDRLAALYQEDVDG